MEIGGYLGNKTEVLRGGLGKSQPTQHSVCFQDDSGGKKPLAVRKRPRSFNAHGVWRAGGLSKNQIVKKEEYESAEKERRAKERELRQSEDSPGGCRPRPASGQGAPPDHPVQRLRRSRAVCREARPESRSGSDSEETGSAAEHGVLARSSPLD